MHSSSMDAIDGREICCKIHLSFAKNDANVYNETTYV